MLVHDSLIPLSRPTMDVGDLLMLLVITQVDPLKKSVNAGDVAKPQGGLIEVRVGGEACGFELEAAAPVIHTYIVEVLTFSMYGIYSSHPDNVIQFRHRDLLCSFDGSRHLLLVLNWEKAN